MFQQSNYLLPNHPPTPLKKILCNTAQHDPLIKTGPLFLRRGKKKKIPPFST